MNKLTEKDLGKYYLVRKFYIDNDGGKLLAGKFIGITNEFTNCLYLFEFMRYIYGHDGHIWKLKAGHRGKKGHCWYVMREDVKKELSEDEALAYLI